MEKELRKQLWLSRAFRCTAEQQKFHLLACAVLALGNDKKYEEFFKKSEKFGLCVPKCLKMAVANGLEIK